MTLTEQAPTRAEQAEAKARRLMAKRAALPNTWVNRARRHALLADIDRALDELEAR